MLFRVPYWSISISIDGMTQRGIRMGGILVLTQETKTKVPSAPCVMAYQYLVSKTDA